MSTIITAKQGPSLPLLYRTSEDEFPYYTGPLGAARLLVSKTYHVVEVTQFDMKYGAFIANDPNGDDCMEWAVSYVSPEHSLRMLLGMYFHRAGYDSVTLAVALRAVITEQLDQLEGATV